jgi:hypothetical protein
MNERESILEAWSATMACLAGTLSFVLFANAGCSNSGGGNAGPNCLGKGGLVAGPEDDHCVDTHGTPVTQTIGMCAADGSSVDGGSSANGTPGTSGETFDVRYGNAAYDDDCKYSVSFRNSCIALNAPITFTVTLERKSDGSPASGAIPDSPEIFLANDASHISPSNNIKAPEGPAGVYAIGPIVFDKSGRWIVRFHFFESCSDLPGDSPHGHVAFYVDVP